MKAHLESSAPSSDAASEPTDGSPTATTHPPERDTPTLKATARLTAAFPATPIVDPRRTPLSANNPDSSSTIGKVRSRAKTMGSTNWFTLLREGTTKAERVTLQP